MSELLLAAFLEPVFYLADGIEYLLELFFSKYGLIYINCNSVLVLNVVNHVLFHK